MTPGTLLFDSDFEFHDGEIGKKILVALGTANGITVVAKTTSKGARYGNSYGCQSANRFPSFFLPKGCCFLREPTWICLDEFYEFKDTVLLQRSFSGKINRLGELTGGITEQLLECVLEADDISGAQVVVVGAARKAMSASSQ